MLCLFIKVEKEYVHNLQADINSHLKVRLEFSCWCQKRGTEHYIFWLPLCRVSSTMSTFLKNTIVLLGEKKNTVVQMGHFQINMIQAGGCDKCLE